jgi:Tfp pilus assembly protein PilZ
MDTMIKMHKETFDMYSNFIPNVQTKNLERRKDARKKVNELQLVVANCRTMESDFQAPIENVSSGGIFINTNQRLFVGQEIAMKFDFPDAGNTIMANGEIVRTSFEGAGVRFRMFFKK